LCNAEAMGAIRATVCASAQATKMTGTTASPDRIVSPFLIVQS
jgi:hypothetical protein